MPQDAHKVLDVDPSEPVCLDDWRKKGKTIDDVPFQVISAHTDALRIPEQILQDFPNPNLPIIDFIQLTLPKQSSAITMASIDKWFSCDAPKDDVSSIKSRTVPPQDLLSKLREHSQQAWLDGACSITDPRFNKGTERFPLWIITYWIRTSRVINAQTDWLRAREWIEDQSQVACFPDGFTTSTEIFGSIGWDSPRKIAKLAFTTQKFCQLLSTRWLCDDIMALLVEDLRTRLSDDPVRSKDTIIAPSNYYRVFEPAKRRGYHADVLPRCLKRIEHLVDSKGFRYLYIPVMMNENHEIAVYVDFVKKKCGWGACRE